ncbi:hypothetical protein EHQ68_17180 [Leptospira congkakensis]|uniref:Carboxypeptidase regulatory-like domain-containing protein n=1 Tax=Leptospira congkakensis TaxID=2484932 RepID=A0A4Z1AFM3_9LEPT|nr:hypothetical protein EHQ68_17180 [Leptospira congkakensis]TGL92363.1 hypothetical protein EHQ69_08470 [Leptospira congkakensis]TGM00109.1 hypothetical protein EHQ70_00425 [Leptospira congkakensis]
MPLKKTIGLLVFSISFFQNCYFNPIVNGILNPVEEKNDNSFLSLLGLGPGVSDLKITGQIRNQYGTALANLVLAPSPISPQSKSILPPYTTDSGGRFYLPFQSGRISFVVSQNDSPLFTLSLDVLDPTSITAEISGTSELFEISNLGTMNGSESPSFFELVRVFTLEGESEVNIHNVNLGKAPNAIFLEFNEAPADVEPGNLSWAQNSVIISPAIGTGYLPSSIFGNQIPLMAIGEFTYSNVYTIDFTSNIKSASGNSLTPRRIKFCYSLPEACAY